MRLYATKIGFQPGINKQITPTEAEGQWIDYDNVRLDMAHKKDRLAERESNLTGWTMEL